MFGKEYERVEFYELLKKRRSIRDFEDKEVPLEIIREIVNESCLAPSAANGQPWRFIIVKNKVMIKRLSDESKKTDFQVIFNGRRSIIDRILSG